MERTQISGRSEFEITPVFRGRCLARPLEINNHPQLYNVITLGSPHNEYLCEWVAVDRHRVASLIICSQDASMSRIEMYRLLNAVIAAIEPGPLTDDDIEKLSFFVPNKLLVGALDLIDRECVIKYKTPWGRFHFQVLGSMGTYTVFPTLPHAPALPCFCSCPAFAFSVMISHSVLMCKHVLAARIAERLGQCVERTPSEDDFASLLFRQQSNM